MLLGYTTDVFPDCMRIRFFFLLSDVAILSGLLPYFDATLLGDSECVCLGVGFGVTRMEGTGKRDGVVFLSLVISEEVSFNDQVIGEWDHDLF